MKRDQNFRFYGKYLIISNDFLITDPYADEEIEQPEDGLVHIRVHKQAIHKFVTTVSGVPEKYHLRTILKCCMREFGCKGGIKQNNEFNEVMLLQGDRRTGVYEFLTENNLVSPECIRVHGN
ncbi:unnamed protein product [Hymenolepis diminuta]|uniref:SUI1 domain-containing protein n=1 Tax=Hymenolepis diminuta TaxID=6216 RepID=A0A0R3STF7_HYMDI|nr:unnamed protein product [Hymenolepis diminuta]